MSIEVKNFCINSLELCPSNITEWFEMRIDSFAITEIERNGQGNIYNRKIFKKMKDRAIFHEKYLKEYLSKEFEEIKIELLKGNTTISYEIIGGNIKKHCEFKGLNFKRAIIKGDGIDELYFTEKYIYIAEIE